MYGGFTGLHSYVPFNDVSYFSFLFSALFDKASLFSIEFRLVFTFFPVILNLNM